MASKKRELFPAERSLLARASAHTSWAHTKDRSARTAPARAAMDRRFEREVDPEGTLSEAERKRRAEYARRAYFARLAHASAKARKQRKDHRAA